MPESAVCDLKKPSRRVGSEWVRATVTVSGQAAVRLSEKSLEESVWRAHSSLGWGRKRRTEYNAS